MAVKKSDVIKSLLNTTKEKITQILTTNESYENAHFPVFRDVLLASPDGECFKTNPDIKYIAGLACIFGHCYPIFAGFRGGKAVSTCLGYFLCIEPLYAIVAIVVFLSVLKISKYVSLSSISTSLIVLAITPFLDLPLTAKICMTFAVILLVYRHKENIKRIKNHTESKIQWM